MTIIEVKDQLTLTVRRLNPLSEMCQTSQRVFINHRHTSGIKVQSTHKSCAPISELGLSQKHGGGQGVETSVCNFRSTPGWPKKGCPVCMLSNYTYQITVPFNGVLAKIIPKFISFTPSYLEL